MRWPFPDTSIAAPADHLEPPNQKACRYHAVLLSRGPSPRPARFATAAASLWRAPRTPLAVAVAIAFWLTTVGNVALWRKVYVIDPTASGVAVEFGVACVLFATHVALLAPLAWGRAIKPVGMAAVLAAAIAQHFMLRFGVVIDAGLMGNTFSTNATEARDVLGATFALDLAAVAALPIVWLWQVPIVRGKPLRDAGRRFAVAVLALVVAAGLVAAMFRVLAPMVRNHLELRYLPNPISPLLSAAKAATRSAARRQPVHVTATAGAGLGSRAAAAAAAKPPLVVLVVGETARADHFGLNGYARDTTPELAARGVVSFPAVYSCGTHTAASVPCMFSPLGKAAYKPDAPETGNLLDVVQAAGMAVLWVDNQAGCKDVCDRVPNASTKDLAGSPEAARLCSDGECLDEALLLGLDRRIAALPEAARRNGVLVVLHQMGSHGPAYSRRSPQAFKRFQPECTTLVLGECTHEGLVNAYDNSIAYTDHVLASTIDWLRSQSAAWAPAMLYVSDHGESLGEYGVFLHGLPDVIAPEVQKHVPMVAWLGDAIAARDHIDLACVARERSRRLSHDNLYHSVMGLLDVVSPTYRADLDVFAPCREPAAAGKR